MAKYIVDSEDSGLPAIFSVSYRTKSGKMIAVIVLGTGDGEEQARALRAAKMAGYKNLTWISSLWIA